MKGFVKKMMLSATLLILSIVLLTYFFLLYFRATEESRYRVDSAASFASARTFFDNGLLSARSLLDALSMQNIPLTDVLTLDVPREVVGEGFVGVDLAGDEFLGLGYMILGENNEPVDVVFAFDGEVRSKKCGADTYRGFGEYAMLSVETGDKRNFLFGKRADRTALGYDYMFLVSDSSPLSVLYNYSFTNFALYDHGGVVVDVLYEDAKITGFSRASYDGEYITIGKTSYLVSAGRVENFGEYSLIALIDRAVILAQISEISVRFNIFMGICCVLMFAFFAVFLMLIRIDKAIIGTGEYRIDVDVSGNIKRTDKRLEARYKKFVGNIASYVERDFSDDCFVLKAETVSGERAYLNCKKFAKRKSSDYIFMASDATDLYSGYVKFRLEHFTDEITELNNIQQLEIDFGTALSSRSVKELGFVIYELGIEKYWALYGVEFYKRLLKTLADRLSDIYVWQAKAYHLAGDRFIILAEKNPDEIVAKIDSAIQFFSAPVRIDELIIRTAAKAGYVIYAPEQEVLSLSQIISRLELALSYAKNSPKKNNYGYVDSIMKSKQILSNEDIREVIAKEELRVCFQPQYSLKKKCIVGFEALTRLGGKYSYINPGAFIENVEQAGAMILLGDYIMDKSMKFAASLPQKDVKISVNVSPLQLLSDKFVERFIMRLQEYKLEPSQIGIEITETYEMSSMAKAREKLRELQKKGIQIGIDDFGEKYSSLRYIKSLPIDFIKIDKGFVDGLTNDKYSRAIIEMIVELAHKLSLYTTIEGVETIEQVQILTKIGADLIQGYIISQAVEETQARELIMRMRNVF